MNADDRKHVVLLGLFITSLTASNYLAAKIATLGSISGVSLLVPAGVVAYAATFTITDIIGEVYREKSSEDCCARWFYFTAPHTTVLVCSNDLADRSFSARA